MTDRPGSEPERLAARFMHRFWLPPRAHGEIIEDRSVSFLELFYDLVYVVVVARAAHTLAEHPSWRTVGEFSVVFSMIYIAWINGTVYYELHGREEGRTRTFVFLQMLILALLAVFTADAAGDTGGEFAVVYALYMVVLGWLWQAVRRRDPVEMRGVTGGYVAGMVASVVIVGATAAVSPGWRITLWAVFVVMWMTGVVLLDLVWRMDQRTGLVVTDSMVERFGLFVIIVLGEVVVGIVTGLSEVDPGIRSVATGLIGLAIGFGIWWTYFDFVGRRLPREDGFGRRLLWMAGHWPVTMAIAASGAGLVTLVEHASDRTAPENSAWLLTGSVAVALAGLIVIVNVLRDARRLRSIYRPLTVAMTLAAGGAILVGWWRPSPWQLALSLVALLLAVWLTAVVFWLRLDDPELVRPNAPGSGPEGASAPDVTGHGGR